MRRDPRMAMSVPTANAMTQNSKTTPTAAVM